MATFPNVSETFPNGGSERSTFPNGASERFPIGESRNVAVSASATVASEEPFRTGDQSRQALTAGPALSGKDRPSAQNWPNAPRCGQQKRNGKPCAALVRTELGYTTCWSHGAGRGRTSTPLHRGAIQ